MIAMVVQMVMPSALRRPPRAPMERGEAGCDDGDGDVDDGDADDEDDGDDDGDDDDDDIEPRR